jgi:hypothetical protein
MDSTIRGHTACGAYTMKAKIHPDLQSKLEEQKEIYEKVTAFAELLPMFSKTIISNELSGDGYCELTKKYGQIYLDWGVNWIVCTPHNYPEEKSPHPGLVNVYINCMSLFGDKLYHFARGELAMALPGITVHFYDSLNSTFYFLPEEVEDGLKKINDWYVSTKHRVDAEIKKMKKAELERQLKELSK